MNILLITPRFFDYPQQFISQLNEMGHQVDWYDDRPSSNSFIKAIIRVNKKFINVLGPTGVGKTTTIAKMAARAVLEKKKKIGFISYSTKGKNRGHGLLLVNSIIKSNKIFTSLYWPLLAITSLFIKSWGIFPGFFLPHSIVLTKIVKFLSKKIAELKSLLYICNEKH